MSERHIFFATCLQGLEPVLHAEAKHLRLARIERQVGGVHFEGTLHDAWRANLELRTAGRVLLRVARFEAGDGDALYRGASGVDWTRFLSAGGTLHVQARSNQSQLDHTLFVEQRVKDAVVDGFREREGQRPSVDATEPDLRIHVHLFRDRCTLLADTTGAPLYKRGWRRTQGRAPLTETLAAGLLALSDWDGRSPLIDPFCGSGTILVEAALRASGIPVGSFRDGFAFERWPGHEAPRWRKLLEAARSPRPLPKRLVLRGSDSDPARLEDARANLAAVGWEEQVQLELADAAEFAPRRGWNGWVVSNLPYGRRVGSIEPLVHLHRRFGARLREHCAGYHVALLTGDPRLADALELHRPTRLGLRNGPIECELVLAQLDPDDAAG